MHSKELKIASGRFRTGASPTKSMVLTSSIPSMKPISEMWLLLVTYLLENSLHHVLLCDSVQCLHTCAMVNFFLFMQKSSQDELKQQLAKVFEEKHKSELASKVNYATLYLYSQTVHVCCKYSL